MRTTWKLLRNESKQNDSVELSRFFVFGGGKVKREKMKMGRRYKVRKLLPFYFIFIVEFVLVHPISHSWCGSAIVG